MNSAISNSKCRETSVASEELRYPTLRCYIHFEARQHFISYAQNHFFEATSTAATSWSFGKISGTGPSGVISNRLIWPWLLV